METNQYGHIRTTVVVSCVLILVTATALITAWAVNDYVSASFMKGVFYRTPKQLSHDGVSLVDVGKRQEQVFHEMIWDYYQTEYPKMLKERFEERLTDALDDKTREKYSSMLNRLGVARLAPPLFSAPRRRDGFGDTIGIMAYSYMYTPEETIPHKGEFMFFFSKKDGVFSLDKVYLLGEDPGRFETSPWDRMNRENVN